MGRERLRRVQSAGDHHSIGQQGDIVPIAQSDGLAHLKAVILGVHLADGHAADAKKHRALVGKRIARRRGRFRRISGHDYLKVGYHPSPCYVFDGVVCWSELSIRHP